MRAARDWGQWSMANRNSTSDTTRRRIEAVRAAVRDRDWELARILCDDEWTELREQIDRGERAHSAVASNEPILVMDDFALSSEGSRSFDREPDLTGDLRGPGVCRTYSVTGPGSTLLQLDSFELEGSLHDVPVWIVCRDAFQSLPEFQRLTSGMRLGSQRLPRGGRSYLVGVVRFGTGAKQGSSINKVGLFELNEIVDGDAERILRSSVRHNSGCAPSCSETRANGSTASAQSMIRVKRSTLQR